MLRPTKKHSLFLKKQGYRKQVQKTTEKTSAENNLKSGCRKQVQKTSAENKCRKQITNN